MTGKISTFGGPHDSGMKDEEGLSLYEHAEADLRPDLFLPRGMFPPHFGTARRLNPATFYFAMRFDVPPDDAARKALQRKPFFIATVNTPQLATTAFLVDWGPAESTGRTFDLSPALAAYLELATDFEINVAPL